MLLGNAPVGGNHGSRRAPEGRRTRAAHAATGPKESEAGHMYNMSIYIYTYSRIYIGFISIAL